MRAGIPQPDEPVSYDHSWRFQQPSCPYNCVFNLYGDKCKYCQHNFKLFEIMKSEIEKRNQEMQRKETELCKIIERYV